MRPLPPRHILDNMIDPIFEPSTELRDWAYENFIREESPIFNPDHAHLQQAEIGFLWTNWENTKKGKLIAGQCQLLNFSGDKWSGGRSMMQIGEWFGTIPDFLITIFAPVAVEMEDYQFMGLIEHELYHAGQDTDAFGMPKFSNETGLPIWTTKAHDIEEFLGVIDRYGSVSPQLAAAAQMVNRGPKIAYAEIKNACGTCLRLVK